MSNSVYLLHFKRPISLKHTTQHYLGYTSDLDQRIRQHRQGAGSRLCQVAEERGIEFKLAEVWTGNRGLERRLKNYKQSARFCPICQRR